nr:MAG TPA: integrase [Caudoviricetes sp.]
MPGRITTVSKPPKLERKKRVAAYARVSSGKDAMLHSLSAQVSHYSDLIQRNSDWLYAGVYADEAKTGTKDSRADFQRLIADCHAGKIDMVITKSISRFARNTVMLLQTVRDFKAWEVDIFFEEQNIHTMSADGELMLTILASYAQEESRSASENQKWRIKRNFEEGMPWNGAMLGYRLKDERYEVVPKEAELVRRIYNEYLAGDGYLSIVKRLMEEDVPSRFGGKWNQSVVSKILSNYTYTGNLLLQKTFRENHITKKTVINHGELPKYHAENTHEAIIDMKTFHAVQTEKARRAAQFNKKPAPRTTYPFTSLLVCDNCGKNYRRKTTKTGIVWVCGTFNTLGKSACASKQIPETTLQQVTAEVLGAKAFTREQLHSRIQSIRVCNGNILIFCFKDGSEVTRTWKDRSRSESWTDEMKKAARQKALERSKHNA